MSTSITRRTELAHRASDGIDVYLFWNEPTSRVTVCVLDGRSDNGFELKLDGRQALDAFNHPFAVRPAGPTAATTNPRRTAMQARIDNPAFKVPGALKALQELGRAVRQSDVPETTLYLVELPASQINGCSICVDIHSHELRLAGEPIERINAVAAWRETPYFTDAERAALALAEAATRLADRPDAVPDESGTGRHATTTRRNSQGSWSRSRRSTPSTASTRPPGRSPATGYASGSSRATRAAKAA